MVISRDTFKFIPGYEGRYSVSPFGIVKSHKRYTAHRENPRLVNEKILKQRYDKYGYKTVGLSTCGKIKWFKIHRLVALVYIGPSSLTVNHKDFNKTNNHIDNLEYCTSSENTKHFNKHHKRNIPKKIKDCDILMIKEMRKSGMNAREISKLYNTHISTIYKKWS